MEPKIHQLSRFLIFVLLLFSGKNLTAASIESCSPVIGRVVSVKNTVELSRTKDLQQLKQIQQGEQLCSGNLIRTRIEAEASISAINGKFYGLGEETIIEFGNPRKQKDMLHFVSGIVWIRSSESYPTEYLVKNSTIIPEGTEFIISIDENTKDARITLIEGSLIVKSEYDNSHLPLPKEDDSAYGATIVIPENQRPPYYETKIKPFDDVQWALHYPSIINDYRKSQKDKSRIDKRLLDAEVFLSNGRVKEAEGKIDQVLGADPQNSEAIALQSIIALVQNNKEDALRRAKEAVVYNPESVPALLALAYALQSHHQLDEAIKKVSMALDLAKDKVLKALLLAQRAELRMAVGALRLAIEDAEEAVEILVYAEKTAETAVKTSKNLRVLTRTLTVRGFAYLLEMDTKRAKDSFAAAIGHDQTNSMPRLGMGLALIREGELEAGRVEIEIAVGLEPANSLLRSYLGKVYFEEKRYSMATTQFELAKELDKHDPTPWLYDAIQKQTQNRPVEALQAIEKSIELNDNRAVYRSRLLLDQDQAGRGSSLARIYDNLGFEKRALMETAKSLSYDPANHSAHRFLSDAYTNIPRHEIARVSELLQAQLLQPINVNPVQPHLAVADLNIITNTGPAVTGFNEFTPLFERNKPQLVASGIAGSNNTIGDEVVASMLYDRASISVGQFHYQTDGFRPNNDETHNIYNAFIQYAVTPRFNIQTELRTRKTEHGDLLLDFDLREENNNGEKNFNPYKRRTIEEDVARIGARYAMSRNQDLLVSAKYIDRLEKNNLPDRTLSNAGFQIEAQHIFREKYFNSAIGGSIYQFSWSDSLKINPQVDEIKRENFYTYTNTNFPRNLNTTLGLSYDSFTSSIDGTRADKINPKFGLQWDILDSLRLRFAWFKTTKSHLVAQQSLEPTQVAGFNQFFDDTNGTRARRMGIGLDSQVSNNLYSGIEASARNLLVPVFPFQGEQEHLQAQKEQLIRAYFYWSPHPYWAISGELQFEKFTRDGKKDLTLGDEDPTRIQTFRAPLSIEYFHPSGFFSNFKTTFVEQDLTRRIDVIEAKKRDPTVTNSGVDEFFLLDSVIGYRFPNRRGILSLEGRNLLNQKFFYRNVNFYQSEAVTPLFIPERTFFVRLTLNF